MSSPSDRAVEYRSPAWSPNSSKVVFVEADMTDVRERSVLVPTDPSYPEVQQNRFARVGGNIEKLRIGVVELDGPRMQWLPIDAPAEGMYLGQVEWAGNSDEVLIEKFSRFRNRREFLLVKENGQVQTIFSEVNDAWAESSQGKNSKLVWVQNGKRLWSSAKKMVGDMRFLYSRDGKEIATLTPGAIRHH